MPDNQVLQPDQAGEQWPMDNNSHLDINKRKTFFVFLLLFLVASLINSCTREDSSSYTVLKGRSIAFSFDQSYNYELTDFFLLDDFIISHNMRLESEILVGDTIKIPPRRLIYIEDEKTGKHSEEINSSHMSLNLYDALMAINKNLNFEEQYIFTSIQLLLINGEIHMEKRSKDPIVIKIPAGYPLNAKILKK